MSFIWSEFWDVLLRGVTSLVVLFLITKLLGKKQVSELSLFDYVIGISIGNFAAEITINLDASLIYGVIAVIEFGVFAYIITILTMKSIRLRRFFMGVPTVLIDKGKVLDNALKKVHLDISDLLEECRTNGYFDLNEIEYAVMETNGKISIMPKTDYKTVTLKDLKIKQQQQDLSANVIIDGKIMNKNLSNMNKSEKWLIKQLKVLGYFSIDDILLATLDSNEKLTVYEKRKDETTKNILE